MRLKFDLIRIPQEQRLIPVDISRVSLDKKEDPRFTEVFWAVEALINSSQFDREEKPRVCLHEGTHLFYARRVGIEPKLFGPWIYFNPKTNRFGWAAAGVERLPAHLPLTLHDVAKFNIGPHVVLPELLTGSKRSVEEIEDENAGDLRIFREWYEGRVSNHEKSEPGFKALMGDAHADILNDLKDPRVRRGIWDCAQEFSERIFPSAAAKVFPFAMINAGVVGRQ